MTIKEKTQDAHDRAVDRMMKRFRDMPISGRNTIIEAIASTSAREDVDKDMVALALIGAFAVNGIVHCQESHP